MSRQMFRTGLVLTALLIPMTVVATPFLSPYCGNLPGCGSNPGGLFDRIIALAYTRLELYGYLLGGLFIIIGGARMLTSFGNEERFGAGKTTIIWALIGIFVANFASHLFGFVFQEITSPLGGDLVIAIIALVRSTIFDLMYIALLGVALFSGMSMVLAQGKEEQGTKARNALIYAAVGALVINLADRLISAFVLL
ncbi:MAG: hypothetical protein KBD00_06040 [Candidatus Peribacteraceae bacterium]|nr:hypothetical protein [Candidatus Peribacteraceae bacterium]